MEDHHKREYSFDELSAMLVGGYMLISKLLLRLPIPIALPAITEDGLDGVIAVAAVDKARRDISALPMDALTAAMMQQVLLEWLTAHDQGLVIINLGEEPRRLAAMTATLTRLTHLGDHAEIRLELEEEDEE
ncbi:hypothetical protein DQ384_05225 [Sphaerisporangium album]|uniref:Uncharacterized protein n=1 Tax=Sphaerisporangium album TaxID=509200 RepID=A0A367FQQ5_9ACTN|nr:hypothetical protein [Sphaerisporangium album]RCG31945.1 hypothetical protein DQ384_05225 [Sphaerisporangium album]